MIRLKLLRNHVLGKAGSFIEVPADRATYLIRVGVAALVPQAVISGGDLAEVADRLNKGREVDEDIVKAVKSPEFEKDLFADEESKTKEKPKKEDVKKESKKPTKSKK